MVLKRGDVVRVRKDLVEGNTYNGNGGFAEVFVAPMMDFIGKPVTIRAVYPNGKCRIEEEGEDFFFWTDDMFESIVETEPLKIEKITSSSVTGLTEVKWNDGTSTFSKPHGGDLYDKEKGVAVAIAKKYTDIQKAFEITKEPHFKVGDLLVGIKGMYGITNEHCLVVVEKLHDDVGYISVKVLDTKQERNLKYIGAEFVVNAKHFVKANINF